MSDPKKTLAPLVQKFKDLLMQDLLEQNVVTEKTANGQKTYNLSIKVKDDLIISTETKEDHQTGIDNILALRDLSRTIFQELTKQTDIESIPGREIMKYFVENGVIDLANFATTRVQDILDKGKLLLQEDDLQKEAVQLFDIQNRYFQYVNSLLEYFVRETIKREFENYTVANRPSKNDPDLMLTATTDDINEPTILFEIAYRKHALNSLRDDLFSALEKMVAFDRSNKKDTFLTLIIFTDEGSQAIEKIEYRFKQYIEESFPSYSDQIFLIPLYVKNGHLLKNELQKLALKVYNRNSATTEIKLQAQANADSPPEIDDHVYSKTFDLTRYTYEIRVTPKLKVAHWRFGIRFSKDLNFPVINDRHAKGYYLVHLEKNSETDDVLISMYDATSKQILYGVATSLKKYESEPFVFLISLLHNQTKLDIVNKNRDSILEQSIQILNYPYFKIAAWADRKNGFEFNVSIKERQLRIPQANVELVGRRNTENITVKVTDNENQPVSNCRVLLLAENNTYHEGRTSGEGVLNLTTPENVRYTMLAAHENYPSTIIEELDSTKDIVVILKQGTPYGSIISSQNWVSIPGLEGYIDVKVNSSSKTYIYTQNIAVDGGKHQPVYFDVNQPLILEDRHYTKKKILVRFIREKISLIDFFD